jgi:hypothetical protein
MKSIFTAVLIFLGLQAMFFVGVFIHSKNTYYVVANENLNEDFFIAYKLKKDNLIVNEIFNLNYINNTCSSLKLDKSIDSLDITCFIDGEEDITTRIDSFYEHTYITHSISGIEQQIDPIFYSKSEKQIKTFFLSQETEVNYFQYNIDNNISTLSVNRQSFNDETSVFLNKVNLNLVSSLKFFEVIIKTKMEVRNNKKMFKEFIS